MKQLTVILEGSAVAAASAKQLDLTPAHPTFVGLCGRFLNKLPAAEIARIFGTRNAMPNHLARFKIAPTDPVLAMRSNPKSKERSLDELAVGARPALGNRP